MTKKAAIVSFQLDKDEIELLDEEAKQPPFLGSRSKYCQQIILGRHEMIIQVEPQVQDLLDQHAGALQAYKQENSKVLDQMTSQAKTIRQELEQHYAQQTEDYLKASFDKAHSEVQLDYLQQTHSRLQEKMELTQLENKRLKADHDELTQQLDKFKQAESLANFVTKGVGNLVAGSPWLQERLASDGLSGLVFGASKSPPTPQMAADQALGEALRADFPAPLLDRIKNVLCFLRDNPDVLAQLQASPAYKAYIKE